MKNVFLTVGLAVSLGLCYFSCKKKDQEVTPNTSSSIDSYIKNAKEPIQAMESDTIATGQPQVTSDGVYTCTEKKVSLGYGYNQQIILNPQTDVIYPGALLDGNSIVSGAYTPIVIDRSPLTISTSLENLSGNKSKDVPNPSLSTVRQGISDLLNQGMNGATAANMSFEYSDVSSEKSLNMAIGTSSAASVKFAGTASVSAKIKTSLDYNSSTKKNKFLFRFIQSYYTIDVDAPKSPSAFFAPSVTTETLNHAMPSYSSPVYVSSVNYGRVVYFCIQSEKSFQEVKKSWAVSVSAELSKGNISGNASADISKSITAFQSANNCEVSAVVIGGNAQGGASLVNAMDVAGVSDFIISGANYNKQNPGLPISYVLRKLCDNTIFKVIDYNEFTVRNCQKNQSGVVMRYFRGLRGDNDIYGTITASVGYTNTGLTGKSQIVYFNSRDDYKTLKIDENTAINYASNNVFDIDPLRKNDAFIELTCNFSDRDWPSDLDDPYNEKKVKVYLNGNRSDPNLMLDANGLYIITLQSTINYYSHEYCCRKTLGFCNDWCWETLSNPQDDQFQFAFQLQ